MERCPYCDAQVRSGARFCTSCGRRLSPGSAESPGGGRATGSEEPQAAPAAWETVPSVAERPAGPEDWLRRSPIASADLWPASSRDQATSLSQPVYAPTPAAGDAPPAGTGEGGVEQSAEAEGGAVWPSSPWSTWVVPEAREDSIVASDGEVGTVESPSAMEEPEAPALPIVAAGSADEEPEAALPTVAATSARSASTGDALGRAMVLIAELRGLLPAVAGASGVDLAGALRELSAARDEAAARDGTALDQAAAAVAAARERPREIDALLGLSGSLDALAAALAARERYASAVDRAIELLGGGSAAEQAPATARSASTEDGESRDW